VDVAPTVIVQKHISNAEYCALECVIRPHFDIARFPVPASVRSMALARYWSWSWNIHFL